MDGFVKVGRLQDFPERRGRVVRVDGVNVAVFRERSRVHALLDACPHMGYSLAEGEVREERVVCRGHGWSFDLRTGASDARSGACARVCAVRVEGDLVHVRLPRADAEPAAEADDWVRWDERYLRSGSERAADGEPRAGQPDDQTDEKQ